jgi:hypothetical protein
VASRASPESLVQAEDELGFPDDDTSLQGMPEDARGKVAAQEGETAAVEPKADHEATTLGEAMEDAAEPIMDAFKEATKELGEGAGVEAGGVVNPAVKAKLDEARREVQKAYMATMTKINKLEGANSVSDGITEDYSKGKLSPGKCDATGRFYNGVMMAPGGLFMAKDQSTGNGLFKSRDLTLMDAKTPHPMSYGCGRWLGRKKCEFVKGAAEYGVAGRDPSNVKNLWKDSIMAKGPDGVRSNFYRFNQIWVKNSKYVAKACAGTCGMGQDPCVVKCERNLMGICDPKKDPSCGCGWQCPVWRHKTASCGNIAAAIRENACAQMCFDSQTKAPEYGAGLITKQRAGLYMQGLKTTSVIKFPSNVEAMNAIFTFKMDMDWGGMAWGTGRLPQHEVLKLAVAIAVGWVNPAFANSYRNSAYAYGRTEICKGCKVWVDQETVIKDGRDILDDEIDAQRRKLGKPANTKKKQDSMGIKLIMPWWYAINAANNNWATPGGCGMRVMNPKTKQPMMSYKVCQIMPNPVGISEKVSKLTAADIMKAVPAAIETYSYMFVAKSAGAPTAWKTPGATRVKLMSARYPAASKPPWKIKKVTHPPSNPQKVVWGAGAYPAVPWNAKMNKVAGGPGSKLVKMDRFSIPWDLSVNGKKMPKPELTVMGKGVKIAQCFMDKNMGQKCMTKKDFQITRLCFGSPELNKVPVYSAACSNYCKYGVQPNGQPGFPRGNAASNAALAPRFCDSSVRLAHPAQKALKAKYGEYPNCPDKSKSCTINDGCKFDTINNAGLYLNENLKQEMASLSAHLMVANKTYTPGCTTKRCVKDALHVPNYGRHFKFSSNKASGATRKWYSNHTSLKGGPRGTTAYLTWMHGKARAAQAAAKKFQAKDMSVAAIKARRAAKIAWATYIEERDNTAHNPLVVKGKLTKAARPHWAYYTSHEEALYVRKEDIGFCCSATDAACSADFRFAMKALEAKFSSGKLMQAVNGERVPVPPFDTPQGMQAFGEGTAAIF